MVDRVTISLSEDLVEEINGKLEYGDSRSAWIREAIEERLERERGEENTETTAQTAD
jgi:metal-responsive CopG/Arc/MetJ family transcriptional regulator